MYSAGRGGLYVGIGLLGAVAVLAVLAPLLSPYDPTQRVGPPFAGPSRQFLLGTNDVGQDLLSEVLHGARVSLLVGTTAALLGTIMGSAVGLAAGLAGRAVDAVLMRLVDLVLALPLVPLTIVIGVYLGPGIGTQIAVITAVMWARPARELRSAVLSLRTRDDIRAARMMGAGTLHLCRRHLVPALLPVVVPQFVLAAKTAILLEAALSFLGLGDPGVRSWGTTLSQAYQRSAFLTGAWLWWVIPPGVGITVTVLGFALIGNRLEQQADRRPRPPGPVPWPTDPAGSTEDWHDPPDDPLVTRQLTVGYPDENRRWAIAVDQADLTVAPGRAVGLVGASGSGKSSLIAAALGLLAPGGQVIEGRRWLCGRDVDQLAPEALRHIHGDRVALVPQNAQAVLNPVMRIGTQIAEAIFVHDSAPRRGRGRSARMRDRVCDLMHSVELSVDCIDAFPHQLSGGMRQRAVIAMALANDPDLLVADEPTSGLDVVLAANLVALLQRLRRQRSMALLLISHDLALVLGLVDEIVVVDRGRVVEAGSVHSIGTAPSHPVTVGMLDRGLQLPGRSPATTALHRNSSPAPEAAQATQPEARRTTAVPTLSFQGVSRTYGRGIRAVQALRSVSFTVSAGEHVGVVGTSGAGKSTLALLAAGVERADAGQILLSGIEVTHLTGRAGRRLGRRRHLVFQDPYTALPPGRRIADVVAEPLVIHGHDDPDSRHELVLAALSDAGLSPAVSIAERRTDELSGGERQRVALARAVIGRPALLIADEPTAQMDAGLRVDLLGLLAELAERFGMSVVHITHDLALAGTWVDRLLIIDRGVLVEEGPTAAVLAHPEAEATQRLLDAAERVHSRAVAVSDQ
ncbi:hypothetical protein BH23ACT9_BH23ACT9_11790 [soil metagenome]